MSAPLGQSRGFFFLVAASALLSAAFTGSAMDTKGASKSVHLIGDFNGDRISDVAVYRGGAQWSVRLSNGRGFDPETVWAKGQDAGAGVWAGDFNGDGTTDKLTLRTGSRSKRGWYVAVSTRDPHVRPPRVPPFIFAESRWASGDVPSSPPHVVTGDFNGDGLDDIAYLRGKDSWVVMLSNGHGFRKGRSWVKKFPWGDGVVAADIDSDGRTDLIRHMPSGRKEAGGWFVAFSRATGVHTEALKAAGFASGPQTEATSAVSEPVSNILVGDFKGHGKVDILVSPRAGATAVTNKLRAAEGALSYSAGSLTIATTAARGGIAASDAEAGDFDGDGVSDLISGIQAGPGSSESWTVSATPDSAPREVGVCYFASHYVSPPGRRERERVNTWGDLPHDPEKIPVVGWGSDTLTGAYSCQDPVVLRKQLSAMKRAGIDFIILDISNGISTPTLPRPPYRLPSACEGFRAGYPGDGLATNGSRAVLRELEKDPSLPRAAIALGFEWWGRYTLCAYGIQWDTWAHQQERQQNALAFVREEYVRPFPKAYYRYLGKPLLILELASLNDYPWKDEDRRPQPKPIIPDFTVRIGCEWGVTFAGWPGEGWSRSCCNPDSEKPYLEGVNTLRVWAWGEGARDNSAKAGWPLPASTELMSVLPGNRMWTLPSHPMYINRRGGQYYIGAWKQVLAAMPRKVLIADWNNFAEETAIEGCAGPGGWKDLYGDPAYDWYLQITAAYASIFKTGKIPDGVVFREDGDATVYEVSQGAVQRLGADFKPHGKPIIELPTGWLGAHAGQTGTAH